MTHELPRLAYAYDALEPHMDALTVSIHHGKHHQAYVNNLNAALEPFPDLAGRPLDDLLQDLSLVPESARTAVRNHGGGTANHNLFWECIGPRGGAQPAGDLSRAIDAAFGSFEAFRERLTQAGMTRFGSGWAWLSMKRGGDLVIESTLNQDTPLSEGRVPILTVDVWEHAYYLKYQNRRNDWLAAWWSLADWSAVADKYAAALARMR